MSLINEVKKIKPPTKSEVLRVRCSPHFKKLLSFWVDKTESKSYSNFIRQLVMVATAESKNGRLTDLLNKDLNSHEY
jgi:hypothetical protein